MVVALVGLLVCSDARAEEMLRLGRLRSADARPLAVPAKGQNVPAGASRSGGAGVSPIAQRLVHPLDARLCYRGVGEAQLSSVMDPADGPGHSPGSKGRRSSRLSSTATASRPADR